MKKVFILATCRNEALLPMTTLVFDTLRTGFPTAEVHVHGNALDEPAKLAVKAQCKRTRARFFDHPATIHHLFVEHLCLTETEPFVLLDTDIILFEPVEHWTFEESLAGWRIPEFNDEFTGARTRARLHTSLLFVDPVMLRADIAAWRQQFPVTVFNPTANLFHPLCLPFRGGGYFYDTAAFLYQAVGGTAFSDRQLDAFCHFHFGTIPDVVLPRLKDGAAMMQARAAVLQNPVLGRGLWREQLRYYEARQ